VRRASVRITCFIGCDADRYEHGRTDGRICTAASLRRCYRSVTSVSCDRSAHVPHVRACVRACLASDESSHPLGCVTVFPPLLVSDTELRPKERKLRMIRLKDEANGVCETTRGRLFLTRPKPGSLSHLMRLHHWVVDLYVGGPFPSDSPKISRT